MRVVILIALKIADVNIGSTTHELRSWVSVLISPASVSLTCKMG